MKKLIVILLFGVSTITAAIPAIAGPDWQLIEQGRHAKIVQIERERVMKMQDLQPSDSSHAGQTRKDAQMERMMQDCEAMMKK
jgi:hypothetical protein